MRTAQRCIQLGALLTLSTLSLSATNSGRIIGGEEVDNSKYKEIVRLQLTDTKYCTATIVGPKALITSAQCAGISSSGSFSIDGTRYTVSLSKSPNFEKEKHDLAAGVLDKAVSITPANIGGTAKENSEISMFGYGCTKSDGSGGDDGRLRMGNSLITKVLPVEMISQKKDTAVACFGDGGGPVFQSESGKKKLLGVISRGNSLNTSYHSRLDIASATSFLNDFASSNGSLVICGVTEDCDGSDPQAPTCTIASDKSSIKKGETVTLSLQISGNAKEASINGVGVNPAVGTLTTGPQMMVGTITATGRVANDAGENTCTTTYQVTGDPTDPKPTCTLSAIPKKIKLGETLIVTIRTQGNVTQAWIDGTPATPPEDSKGITPTTKGQHISRGWVSGPGGQSSCEVSYSVDDGTVQPIPDLAVVPVYCGKNTLSQTQVDSVCLSILKNVSSKRAQFVNQALQVTYRDGVTETLPLVEEKSTSATEKELIFYTNKVLNENGYDVLDVRKSTLTLTLSSGDGIPSSIRGRSTIGDYFIVDSLATP